MKQQNHHIVNKILEVHNLGSAFNSYYDILSPIQVTLETCSGITDDKDYINILMLSPEGSYHHQFYGTSEIQYFNGRKPHQHNYFELLLVLKGEIIQQIESKEYVYRTGSCCLINRNVMHSEKFSSEAQVLFIGLSTDFILDIVKNTSLIFFTKQEQFHQNAAFSFMKENIDTTISKSYLDFLPTFYNDTSLFHLHKLSDLLIHSMLIPKFGSSYMIKGIICELFDYLSNHSYYHLTAIKLSSQFDYLLFSHVNHLLEDTNGRISRSELEHRLNYSGNYINTIVKKYTGMCLFDYGMTFCLKKAEYLLLNTNESISSIAKILKFTNRTHFYQLFKKTYGMTPQEYKNVNQNITQKKQEA